MTRTRFLTGSLATLAVASAFTLATPAAQAADVPAQPCGTAAVDAVTVTYIHEPVFRTVPAVTHLEWTWERDVTTYEHLFAKETSPARTETDWVRKLVGATEYLFTRTVIDRAAVPAVPGTEEIGHEEIVILIPAVSVTEYEYRQRKTGKIRWDDDDHHGDDDHGDGWSRTGNTRIKVIKPAVTTTKWIVDKPATPGTPAVPELSHVESTWATEAPEGYVTKPIDSRPGETSVERETTSGTAPDGDGWVLEGGRKIPAEIDYVWAVTAPDGYDPVGKNRVADVTHQVSEGTSTDAPEGDDWTKVADSETVVVDAREFQELVTPGFTEDVLVSPAIPAGEPCVEAPTTDPEPGDTEAVVSPAAEVAAPAQGAAGPADTVLPNTGNDIPPWMAPAGLAALLAGVGLTRLGRRTEAR